MSININRVLIGGNLTRDPTLKHIGSRAVVEFAVAMNRRFRDGQGESREEVTFVDCEAWGRTAEFVGQHFHKGKAIFVEGRLRLNTWQDQAGQKRSRLVIAVDRVQFVDRKDAGAGAGAEARGDERKAG